MKKLIMVALASVILLTGVFSGCTAAAKAFTEPDQIINTGVNKEFTIALESNITTGYSWQVAYDDKALNLVENTYKEQDNTGKQIVGAGGTEYFTFKALSKGETQVTFTYHRPWEQPSAQDQTVVFTINVK
ncbi:MAG TPA: protease inhibitor I42 family protein [Dehalococcoidia bacterium]|nr:protease inhibitor I42 family protein [Dehalococcoidia bacterium]